MSSVLEKIKAAARKSRRHIVLAEGDDLRIQQGGMRAVQDGLAKVTFLGNIEKLRADFDAAGCNVGEGQIIDPSICDISTYTKHYYELRKHRGASLEDAEKAMRNPLNYAAMMVRLGDADGTVAGAVATTGDTVRAAFQIIGRAEGVNIVSSVFLMICEAEHFEKKGTFLFGDCALIINPSAEQLADIALASAQSCRQFLEIEPRIAMLSFSTAGSAKDERVEKINQAARRVREKRPDLIISDDMQFDSAFVPAIAKAKAPLSSIHGNANVFIFPNLEAGNIGYKIAQRIGGATAVGPLLQGLAKPANDLSRGCSVQDVYDLIAITAVQAGG